MKQNNISLGTLVSARLLGKHIRNHILYVSNVRTVLMHEHISMRVCGNETCMHVCAGGFAKLRGALLIGGPYSLGSVGGGRF